MLKYIEIGDYCDQFENIAQCTPCFIKKNKLLFKGACHDIGVMR